ncbi:hypothetical protein AB6A40_004060 [Gnathostoma spinigerum]|uniref:CCR4-NOT transcription complex subunit 11 n=1 Tax=Gnathostoma spinigerum TaxID=75299 RepID=A0ABD6EIX6_9BILA
MLPTSQDVQNSKPSNELSKSDIMFINAVCSWTGKPFDCIGDAFIEMFFRKRTALAVGSAIVTVLGEYDDLSLQQQRLILLYLLYRIDELEVLSGEKAVFPGDKSESVLYHPFLAVFLSLMTLPKDAFIGKDLAVGFSFSLPHITPQEKHMLGCLLTGKTSQVNPLTPFEFAKLPIVNENYDLSRHRAALELQQHSFPLLALVSIPSVLKAPDGNFRVRSGDEFDGILDALNELLTGHDPAMSCSVLPPPFHRLIPALMPPSDDEFQFLYPFQLEPLWMENGSAVFSESNPAEASLSNEMASVSGLCGVSDEVCNVQSESSSIDDEGVMVLKSGDEFENKDEITKSDVTAVSPHFHHERKPLERAEVIELLVKSLECRIGDCQRVAEAIAADPSIAEVTFDLPIEKFPRFIDDNATIASAVIYERVMKDPTSLET